MKQDGQSCYKNKSYFLFAADGIYGKEKYGECT